jgi:hypothetical protein
MTEKKPDIQAIFESTKETLLEYHFTEERYSEDSLGKWFIGHIIGDEITKLVREREREALLHVRLSDGRTLRAHISDFVDEQLKKFNEKIGQKEEPNKLEAVIEEWRKTAIPKVPVDLTTVGQAELESLAERLALTQGDETLDFDTERGTFFFTTDSDVRDAIRGVLAEDEIKEKGR